MKRRFFELFSYVLSWIKFRQHLLNIFGLVMLLGWHLQAFSEISITIDPPVVALGETIRLTVTIENPHGGGIPDLTPLQEHFHIVGTERNMSYSIVNGQTRSAGQWTVLLTPKKTGVLPIPSIRIGHQQTTAGHIEVTENKSATTPSALQHRFDEDVIIKTQARKSEVFVNQQVIYTVKLYHGQPLLDAEYQPPTVKNALLIPLGDGRRYETEVDGHRYVVEEQPYAIFPQKSGDLTITPPSLDALVYAPVPKRIHAESKTRTLTVKPIPKNFKGKYWLPASQVALTEVYDQPDLKMKQGSTLIRTITLQANGVPAQLLPILTFATSPQFNLYAEKPELQNTARPEALIGRADVKVTYVLNTAGRIRIPPLHVVWFHVDTGKEETVSLPERIIDVEATQGHTSASNQIVPLDSDHSRVSQRTGPSSMIDGVEPSFPWAWWWAGGCALLGLLIAFLLGFRHHTRASRQKNQRALHLLRSACQNNNAHEAQSALLRWANGRFPGVDVLNVHQLGKLVHDTALKKQLFLLSQALYRETQDAEWQGEALWRSMVCYLRKKPTKKNQKRSLPPINPN